MKLGVLVGSVAGILPVLAPAAAQVPEPHEPPFQPIRVAQFSR